MACSITILGSGTSVPSSLRRPPAYWVRAPGVSLLMECGSGCSTSLVRRGGDLAALDGALISHLHPDHTAELVPLLLALANPRGPARARPLRIWGPRGLRAYHRALLELYGSWVEPREGHPAVEELADQQELELGQLRITAFSVEHSGESLALRLDDGQRVVCYSGDSGPCEGLTRAARDADLLICECAAGPAEELPGHLNPAQVGRLATEAGCKEVVLTHLYDVADPEARLPIVARHYSGPVRLAADGMIV